MTKIPLLLLLLLLFCSFWKKNAPKNIVAHRLDHTTLIHYIKMCLKIRNVPMKQTQSSPLVSNKHGNIK